MNWWTFRMIKLQRINQERKLGHRINKQRKEKEILWRFVEGSREIYSLQLSRAELAISHASSSMGTSYKHACECAHSLVYTSITACARACGSDVTCAAVQCVFQKVGHQTRWYLLFCHMFKCHKLKPIKCSIYTFLTCLINQSIFQPHKFCSELPVDSNTLVCWT